MAKASKPPTQRRLACPGENPKVRSTTQLIYIVMTGNPRISRVMVLQKRCKCGAKTVAHNRWL